MPNVTPNNNQAQKKETANVLDMTGKHVEVYLEDKKQNKRTFDKIKELKITKAINDHVRFTFDGTIKIPVEIGDAQTERVNYIKDYLAAVNMDMEFIVKPLGIGDESESNNEKEDDQKQNSQGAKGNKTGNQGEKKEEKETVFFRGIVTNVEIGCQNDIYDIHLEGASYTYKLDIQKKNHSFQNKSMTYKALIEKVIGQNAICDDLNSQTDAIGRLFVQYQMTDWAFLARMATQKNSGLIADCIESKPKFRFRVPDNGKKEASPLETFGNLIAKYEIRKNIQNCRVNEKNKQIKDLAELDFFECTVNNSKQSFEIGDKVKFKNQDWYICQVVAEWVGGSLDFHCTLVKAGGLKQKPLANSAIAGVSVEGKVIAVEKDTVKVQFDEFEIDKQEKVAAGELCPFTYASFYTAAESSGWYCMPETGDHVKVYFPTSNEENAFAMCSIRKGKDGAQIRVTKPNIKYFRTKYEKVLLMGEEEIVLACYGKSKDQRVEIRFNDGSGSKSKQPGLITISSYGGITINAQSVTKLHAKNVLRIKGGNEIFIKCKSTSLIKMDAEAKIFGTPKLG